MDPGHEKKRPRTSSGSAALTSDFVTGNLHHYGELILRCTVQITHGIRECGNAVVLKYVCALLNSGGGILHMRNLDIQRGVVLSKHLDTWWSGMENKMADIISSDDICNYFDLVGNHDDEDLYLFVKTAEHLCTIDFQSRLPTDTATHEVTYQSMMKLLVSPGEPGTLNSLPQIPATFIYNHSAEELKKETKQIQFKQLTVAQQGQRESTIPDKIRNMMIRYISAFANHEGGHIYFGIDDVRAAVIGEELNQSDQRKTEHLVEARMRSVIWKDEGTRAVRGVHWDIQFFPVQHAPRKSQRVVVVISVCKFPGGVFITCPESCHVNSDENLADFSFTQWRDAILNPLRDVPELHHRFRKVALMVPRAPLVFTLPNTIDTIKNKTLLGRTGGIQPRRYVESYAEISFRETIHKAAQIMQGDNSIVIGAECWGLRIPMQPADDIICDVVVISNTNGIHILTFSTKPSTRVRQHSQRVGSILKHRLVQFGGCTEKFGVVSHVVDVTQSDCVDMLAAEFKDRDMYPPHFVISPMKFNRILNSCVICMASYKAKSQKSMSLNQHGSYHFLLTHDQFELLWTQQFTQALWVHGPAGAGKTVAAVQLVQELRRRGCHHDNILYLAENEKLCDFVRHHEICLVTTRRQLLAESTDVNSLRNKYGSVCNVIVDEAQNFKDRDGDWYSLAEQISNQTAPSHLNRCGNYFWVFMDYSQKVHKFAAGLPTVIGKNNFMLSEISRSTKEIFDFTSRLMMASENVDGLCSPFPYVPSMPVLAHSYSSGRGVDILSCKESEIKRLLSKVMSGLIKNGIHEDDIAILVGKRSQLNSLQRTLSDIHVTKPNEPHSDTRVPSTSVVNKVTKHDKSESSDSDENVETSNKFNILSTEESDTQESDDADESDGTETKSDHEKGPVKFYAQVSKDEPSDESDDENNSSDTGPSPNPTDNLKTIVGDEDGTGVALDTVRRFSGLDKAAIIGINPMVNKEHADFNRFILSLATRARDNLVIITTQDNVREELERYTQSETEKR